MGAVSRVLLVLLRIGQLACGAIVLGILGHFFHLLSDAGVIDPSARLIFAAAVAGLTVLAALIFMAPLAYSFWAFPIDFFFFAAWLAVFCALVTLTRTNTCEAEWYRTYWGFYWGRWYETATPGVNVMRTGCAAWRTILAFSFVAMVLYLLNAVLGVYWTLEYGNIKSRSRGFLRRHRNHKAFGKTRGSARVNDPNQGASSAQTANTTNNPLPASSAQMVQPATSGTNTAPGDAQAAVEV